jgi:hypothetical protein
VKLHAYAPGGEPRATLAIPGHATGLVRPSVAWDGLRIALGIEGRVLLLDAEGVPLGELVIDAAPADARPLLPREAEELWLFDHEGAIQRYALPR